MLGNSVNSYCLQSNVGEDLSYKEESKEE